jgi:broad specificity phosphatase PhoE
MTGEERVVDFQRMLKDVDARFLYSGAGLRELWLIRHADAYSDLVTLADGPIDSPLSERGRWEAERLAARLAPLPFQAIWSSGLRRARETAAAIARDRTIPVQIDDRLREVLTHWDQGRSAARPAPGVYPFPEPEDELWARVSAALADIAQSLQGGDGSLPHGAGGSPPRAAVVTHGAVISVYLSRLLGLKWGQLGVLPHFTSVSVVATDGERSVVHSIADLSHLAS